MTEPATVHPTLLDPLKGFIADLARPFSIIVTSGAGAWAIVDVGSRVGEGQAAFYVGAVLAGLGGLYFGKAWEIGQVSKHSAEVEKVRAAQSPPPTTALQPAGSDEADPAMFGGPRT